MLARLRRSARNLVPGRRIGERRRYNIAMQDRWEARAAAAVRLWQEHGDAPAAASPLIAVDLGAGNERLRELLGRLPHEVDYHPYDLHPQHPTTARLDVLEDPLPPADLTFALGLIDYVPRTSPFVARLRASSGWVLVSYVGRADGDPVHARMKRGWRRHQTFEELEAEFASAGFEKVATDDVDEGRTRIWLWR